MTDLRPSVVGVDALGDDERAVMLGLMQHVYDGVDPNAFTRDLDEKDECILLHTPDGELVGFSTQRLVSVQVGDEVVRGVFSGDVVVHPRHWGSPALFQAFARRYVVDDPRRWWFLVSKGERTYRLMPLFFREFYPNRHHPTPPRVQRIMDAYATALHGDDYDPATGVLAYRHEKDRLRPQFTTPAGAVAHHPDGAFFESVNPGFRQGHDLVCTTQLVPDNLRPQLRDRLMGT